MHDRKMIQPGKLIATRLIRATAPKGGWDTVFKFCWFMVAIHCVSILSELMLTGRLHMAPGVRFLVSFFSAAPFVLLTLYAVRRSYLLHKQLVALASTDMLTGLMNRRAFVAQMQERLDMDGAGYVMIVDADHFKRVNDTYGHAVGDMCLQAVAERLRTITTAQDVVARIGGEEFGIYVCREPEAIAALGQQLCAAIPVTHGDGPTPLHLTLSAGAASTQQGEPLEQAMRRADEALYQAKASGRARLVTWMMDRVGQDLIRSEQPAMFSPAVG